MTNRQTPFKPISGPCPHQLLTESCWVWLKYSSWYQYFSIAIIAHSAHARSTEHWTQTSIAHQVVSKPMDWGWLEQQLDVFVINGCYARCCMWLPATALSGWGTWRRLADGLTFSQPTDEVMIQLCYATHCNCSAANPYILQQAWLLPPCILPPLSRSWLQTSHNASSIDGTSAGHHSDHWAVARIL